MNTRCWRKMILNGSFGNSRYITIQLLSVCFYFNPAKKVKASKANKNGMRWHPLFIRLCLNIMVTSGKTYNILHKSGFICLPSKRTLRDYTHWHKLRLGFDTHIGKGMMSTKVVNVKCYMFTDMLCFHLMR